MTDSQYVIYTGDTVTTVSLWKREGGKEYPIYANTRGQCEWYSFDPNHYENTSVETLSETCKEWLAHFYRVQQGLLNDESMFPAERVEADQPDAEPAVWYEVELLNAFDDRGLTPEQTDLLEWAHRVVDE
jgi:hypothetical protein